MFINTISNRHKTSDILKKLKLEKNTLMCRYIIGHSIDSELNLVDISSIQYAYQNSDIQLYSNYHLIDQIQQVISRIGTNPKNESHVQDLNKIHQVFHNMECLVFSSQDSCIDATKCICRQLYIDLITHNKTHFIQDYTSELIAYSPEEIQNYEKLVDTEYLILQNMTNISTEGLGRRYLRIYLYQAAGEYYRKAGGTFNFNKMPESVKMIIRNRQQQHFQKLTNISDIKLNISTNKSIQKIIMTMCSNDIIDTPFGKFNQITIDQMFMMTLIFRHFMQKLNNLEHISKQHLYLLDSPTGTGKTENFILSQCITKVLYASKPKYKDGRINDEILREQISNISLRTGINTIVFCNNELVAYQTQERFSKYFQRTFDKKFQRQVSHRIEVILDDKKAPILFLTKCKVKLNDITKELEYIHDINLALSFGSKEDLEKILSVENIKQIVINNGTIFYNIRPRYQCEYICNTRYQYTTVLDGIRIIWDKDISTGREYINYIPQSFRIGDHMESIGDVIILPLYNYQFLNMFGILNCNQRVCTVIYDELDVFYQKSQLETFHKFFFSQLYNLTAQTIIFASATLDTNFIDQIDYNLSNQSQVMLQRQLVMNITKAVIVDSFPVILTVGEKITSTTMEGFQNAIQQSWKVGNNYFYFDLEQSSAIFASYAVIKRNKLTIKTPEYMYQVQGDIQTLEQRLIQEINKFKHVFVTNRLLRNNYFFTIQPYKRDIHANISKLKNVPLLRTVVKKVITLDVNQDRSLTAIYNKLIICSKEHVTIDAKRLLIVTFQDDFMDECMEINGNVTDIDGTQQQDFQNLKDNIAKFSTKNEPAPLLVYDKFLELGYNKLKLSTPFSMLLLQNLKDKPISEKSSEQILYDYFQNIGRGVDIDNLSKVVFIIPLHFDFKRYGFNQSEFKQILGRVGRFGKFGKAVILLLEIDIDSIDKSSKQLVEFIERGQQKQFDQIDHKYFKEFQQKNHDTIDDWLDEKSEVSLSINEISDQLKEVYSSDILI